MKNIVLPIMAGNNVVLQPKTLQRWTSAIWTVKQAQDKFLTAYQATLDDAIPNWKGSWRSDPNFPSRLVEVEGFMQALCRQNGMPLTSFTRYRKAARAATLGDMPFNMAATFSVRELQRIKQGKATAQEIRQQRRLRNAASVVAKSAAVLPLPTEIDCPAEYISGIRDRLTQYLDDAHGSLDDVSYRALVAEMRQCLTVDSDHGEPATTTVEPS